MRVIPLIYQVLNSQGYPPYLIFFVTSKCGSKCKTCFYWKQTQEHNPEHELSIEEIEKISINYKNAPFVSLSGGEPFTRKDLAEICECFYKNSRTKFFNIPTNCLSVEQISAATESILEKCPNALIQIELSLDGIGEVHDNIRGIEGNFEKVLQTHEQLSKLKTRFENLRVKINTTLCFYNHHSILQIIEFARNNLNVDGFSLALPHGDPREPRIQQLDYEIFKTACEKLDHIKWGLSKNNFMNNILQTIHSISRHEIIESLKTKKSSCVCTAVKKIIVINEKGEVFPCEPFFDYKLGSLRKVNYDIKKILNSSKTEQWYNQTIKQNKCTCVWGCAALSNTLFSTKSYLKILKIG